MTKLAFALTFVVGACGFGTDVSGSEADSIEIVSTDRFTIDEIDGQMTFVATAVLVSDEGTFTVEITRDGELTQSVILSSSDAAPDVTLVSKGTEIYALVEGRWIPVEELGAAGLLLLLAAPDIAHQLGVEIRESGTFVGWEQIDGMETAIYEVGEILETVRSEFYTVTGGVGTVWLTKEGLPIRWSGIAQNGVESVVWGLSSIGGPVEIDLPSQLQG